MNYINLICILLVQNLDTYKSNASFNNKNEFIIRIIMLNHLYLNNFSYNFTKEKLKIFAQY
jgi:hypothetical protein